MEIQLIYCVHKIIMEEFWNDEQFVFGSPEQIPMEIPKSQVVSLEKEVQSAQRYKCPTSLKSIDIGTKESDANEKRRLAGQRARQKKKNYLKTLEEQVKQLEASIQRCDKQIYQCKQQLVESLKTSHNHMNEHTYTYAELEKLVASQDPDLDRINLLIDILRNRIGANGKERQANLDYAYKQAINYIFPALYRYILNTAEEQTDIFAEFSSASQLVSKTSSWNHELFQALQLNDAQIYLLNEVKAHLRSIRRETGNHIRRLSEVKNAIVNQGIAYEEKLVNLRTLLSPVQCARMTLFGEKHKHRHGFTFEGNFQEYDKMHKMIKKQQ